MRVFGMHSVNEGQLKNVNRIDIHEEMKAYLKTEM